MKHKTVLRYTEPTIESMECTQNAARVGKYLSIGANGFALISGKIPFIIFTAITAIIFNSIITDISYQTKQLKWLEEIGKTKEQAKERLR